MSNNAEYVNCTNRWCYRLVGILFAPAKEIKLELKLMVIGGQKDLDLKYKVFQKNENQIE
jgi:hypothetical protein